MAAPLTLRQARDAAPVCKLLHRPLTPLPRSALPLCLCADGGQVFALLHGHPRAARARAVPRPGGCVVSCALFGPIHARSALQSGASGMLGLTRHALRCRSLQRWRRPWAGRWCETQPTARTPPRRCRWARASWCGRAGRAKKHARADAAAASPRYRSWCAPSWCRRCWRRGQTRWRPRRRTNAPDVVAITLVASAHWRPLLAPSA
jgi:hypothetical protein